MGKTTVMWFNDYLATAPRHTWHQVCVPEFESTRTVVLLNLRTLEATPVSFEGF